MNASQPRRRVRMSREAEAGRFGGSDPNWGQRAQPLSRRLVEECDEPDYVSVKCGDPDGYIVEAA